MSDDAHEIAGLLFGAADLARARFEALCDRFGLTPVQARALLALAQPVPMRELAGHLRCDPSNVTGIAHRLERRGLVAREAGDDRRVKLLTCTRQGHALRRQLDAAVAAEAPFMAALTPAERRALAKLLRKVNEAATSP